MPSYVVSIADPRAKSFAFAALRTGGRVTLLRQGFADRSPHAEATNKIGGISEEVGSFCGSSFRTSAFSPPWTA